jgi:hypothetical protein
MRHSCWFIALVLLLSLQANAEVEKTVGKQWVWFTDYAYLYSEWTFNVEGGCHVEVAGGMKIGGKPRGSNYIVFGGKHRVITTWGIGAIHVRTTTAFDACRVRMDQGDVGAITIYSDPSLTGAF